MIVEWNLSTQCHAATMLPNRVIITVHVYMYVKGDRMIKGCVSKVYYTC